jgi:Cu2+-exporting ATPase
MGRSCCGSTPSQADAIDKAEVKNPDISSVNCNGGTSSISGQENACESGAVQKDDNSNTTSSAKIADPWCEDPTETSKGKAPPGACEGGCCGDQSAEAVGIKNVPSLGSSASKEACCAENPTTEAGVLNCSVSSGYTPTHASSGAPWSSEPATSAEPIVAECCEGKSSPCCNETCLDRLALRECDTGSNTSCMEAAGRCMLNGKTLLPYYSTDFDTM